MTSKILFFIIACFVLNLKVESQTKQPFIFIEKDTIYTNEFIKSYSKNIDLITDDSKKNIDNYLEQFIDFKLKVKEAKAQQLDTTRSYIRALHRYKSQLANQYLVKSDMSDNLLQQAYERLQFNVHVKHILVVVPSDAKPKDTIEAYNKILKLRQQAVKEGFEIVRQRVHNKKTVFGEDLGYFSVFKMPYSFENIAFNTPVGDISKPFKTRFGYHILYVVDKEISKGSRVVSHILVSDGKDNTSVQTIQAIHDSIKRAEVSFEDMAKTYSEDENTAYKGGVLQRFNRGELNSDIFERKAFELEHLGDISKPFKTKYGWHIVELCEKKPIPSFYEAKSELRKKIKNDHRSQIIEDALISKLKKRYNISETNREVSYFDSLLSHYYTKDWKLPQGFEYKKPLVKIGERQLYYEDFGNFLIKTKPLFIPSKSSEYLAKTKYELFLREQLITYEKEHLGEHNASFSDEIRRFEEGLLCYDVTERNVWEVIKEDSLGMKAFYNRNKEKYVIPKRAQAAIISSLDKKELKKVISILKDKHDLNSIKSRENIVIKEKMVKERDGLLPKKFKLKKKENISKIYRENDTFIVIKTGPIYPEYQKIFQECKGQVISDYQYFKAQKWIELLRKKYRVKFDKHVYKNLKKSLKSK